MTEYVFYAGLYSPLLGTFCNETRCNLNCTLKSVCAFYPNRTEYCECKTPGYTGRNCEIVSAVLIGNFDKILWDIYIVVNLIIFSL